MFVPILKPLWLTHDDVLGWKLFPHYWAVVWREFADHEWDKGPVTRSFDVFSRAYLNKQFNNGRGVTSDLGRHVPHVTYMYLLNIRTCIQD